MMIIARQVSGEIPVAARAHSARGVTTASTAVAAASSTIGTSKSFTGKAVGSGRKSRVAPIRAVTTITAVNRNLNATQGLASAPGRSLRTHQRDEQQAGSDTPTKPCDQQ